MIRILPGDLVAIEHGGVFHYVLVLDRVRLFGANWAYAFHVTSATLLEADAVLGGPRQGFNAFVDFIHARREQRVQRIARGVNVQPYWGPGLLKRTFTLEGRAHQWFITDMAFQEVKRVTSLSPQEREYPLEQAIDETVMINRIHERWSPANDARI